jgi:hypothetical protein
MKIGDFQWQANFGSTQMDRDGLPSTLEHFFPNTYAQLQSAKIRQPK